MVLLSFVKQILTRLFSAIHIFLFNDQTFSSCVYVLCDNYLVFRMRIVNESDDITLSYQYDFIFLHHRTLLQINAVSVDVDTESVNEPLSHR